MSKKSWILVFLMLLPAGFLSANEGLLPPGEYVGTGSWRGPGGSTGQYTVRTTVTGDTLTSRYDYEGVTEEKSTHEVSFVVTEEGTLEVRDADGVVGEGYCFGSECFYRAEFEGAVVEEHFRFVKGELHKLGSKSGPGFRVVWKEVLGAE